MKKYTKTEWAKHAAECAAADLNPDRTASYGTYTDGTPIFSIETPEVHGICPENVEVGHRLRQLDEQTVIDLMASIRINGLLHPIAVWDNESTIGDGEQVLRLAAGWHRLEACKRLGFDSIPCYLFDSEYQADLWEVSENLDRCDLTTMERDLHIARKAELLIAKQVRDAEHVAAEQMRQLGAPVKRAWAQAGWQWNPRDCQADGDAGNVSP
jgi:hypothetical protein